MSPRARGDEKSFCHLETTRLPLPRPYLGCTPHCWSAGMVEKVTGRARGNIDDGEVFQIPVPLRIIYPHRPPCYSSIVKIDPALRPSTSGK